MKKLFMSIIFLVLVLACDGKEGPTGPSGINGINSISSKTVYRFFPSGNPDIENIPEVSSEKIEAGTQIVQIYILWGANEWAEIPLTIFMGPTSYTFNSSTGIGFIRLTTFSNGFLCSDANLGFETMVEIIDLN